MTSLKMLVDEIDLIVTAPYLVDIAVRTSRTVSGRPPSIANALQALHKVTQSVGEDAIRQWCCAKACKLLVVNHC
jgi:hypothetical protein